MKKQKRQKKQKKIVPYAAGYNSLEEAKSDPDMILLRRFFLEEFGMTLQLGVPDPSLN